MWGKSPAYFYSRLAQLKEKLEKLENKKPATKNQKPATNSLASLLANKPKNIERYKIANKHIAKLLGNPEVKTKESVVITLTGGQGSGKTRFAFQFMNALAQNYKVGHASIEEHPTSGLYLDKVEQYIDNKALHNIEVPGINDENPEITSLKDLHKLIQNNEVIVIDSFQKLREIDKSFEIDKDLRKKYNGKLFLVIFQQTTDGKMRGGSTSQFDADIVLFTEVFPNYKENNVYNNKNRYQSESFDNLKYNIFNQKVLTENQLSEPQTQFSFQIL